MLNMKDLSRAHNVSMEFPKFFMSDEEDEEVQAQKRTRYCQIKYRCVVGGSAGVEGKAYVRVFSDLFQRLLIKTARIASEASSNIIGMLEASESSYSVGPAALSQKLLKAALLELLMLHLVDRSNPRVMIGSLLFRNMILKDYHVGVWNDLIGTGSGRKQRRMVLVVLGNADQW